MPATVVSTSEIGQGQYASDGTKGDSVGRSRVFAVVISEPASNGGAVVLSSASLPAPGSLYPSLSAIYCTSRRAALRTGSRVVYDVTCDYGKDILEGTPTDPPWSRGYRYEYGSIEYVCDLEKDFSSPRVNIVNTAGEPFLQPVRVPRYNSLVIVRGARQTWSESSIAPLRGTVNAASFTMNGVTYAAGKLLLRAAGATPSSWIHPTTGAETAYYDATFQIEVAHNEDLFNIVVMSKGYRYKDGSDMKRATCKDASGRVIYSPEPVMLDAAGAQTSTPYYQTFKPYAEASWSALSSA